MTEKRSPLALLTGHWVTMFGAALVTLAGVSWLFALPLNVRGNVENPYIGLLLFVALPLLFFAGLAMIPVGIWLSRNRLVTRETSWRRAVLFIAIMTPVNIIMGSQLTYRAVEHMDTVQFCGQTCHVMKPEFTAHQSPPHQAVACAACHIAPGATGWLHAKMAGTRQLMGVMFNNFPRPIESAIENNRLVSSSLTCEQCHARDRIVGQRIRVLTAYKDDESNSRTRTVLMMLVGGGTGGGIHGAHMGPGVSIRYAAADAKRQTIPWVEYRDSKSGTTRSYQDAGTKPEDAVRSLPKFEMQCVDCHNRAAHSFEQAEHAVDEALLAGRISPSLPFVKKSGLTLLKAAYSSDADAAQRIPAGLVDFYRKSYSDVFTKRTGEVQAAGAELNAIYSRNVFPDLKVTWGTYVNNLGHTDSPGCFRCHDGNHTTVDKKTITQDCSACHNAVAVDEPAPEVLKTLGL